MEYKLVDPALPTIKRWLSLNKRFKGKSTLRMMEYEKLSTLPLEGVVLDLGGGDKAMYRSMLPSEIDYKSVNIDPEINPTWLVKPGEALPIENEYVDNCITMNTLEHVYDPKFLIEELHRVLKKGGCVHITVPWMFRIHGHPDDFTRATPSWWRKTLEDAGFESAEITPLVWGRYCTAGTMTGYGRIFKKLSIHLAHLKDCLYAFVCFRGKGQNYSGKRAQRIYNVALGHFITARK